jgi:hypothetical protein
MASYDAMATRLGFTQSKTGCSRLASLIKTFHLRAVVDTDAAAPSRCRIGVLPEKKQNINAVRHAYIDNANQVLQRSGFFVDEASCKTYAAGIGDGIYDYQFCTARRMSETAS